MRKNLYIVAIAGNEVQGFVESGNVLNWTDKMSLNELPTLLERVNKQAGENDLKTIINVENLNNKEAFIVGRYEMNYITYEARAGDWETENQQLKNYIHKIQAGLF